MKYIFAQPAVLKFQWQLKIALTGLKAQGVDMADVVLLFSKHSSKVPKYLRDKYGVETHVYQDKRDDGQYIPSIRPYLWYQYLSEDSSREQETYCYLDSDVYMLKPVDATATQAKPDKWLCSDCNSYLSLDYIRSCKSGAVILANMATIVGVQVDYLETINHNSGGAQWIMVNPTAEYWKKVYEDCNKLYHYFQTVDTDLQKWTAEMWSQLWNMLYFNIGPQVTNELSFCWATDPIEEWNNNTFYHDAGVTTEMKDLFNKGLYTTKTPFKEDLDDINPSKCSYNYVQAMKKIK